MFKRLFLGFSILFGVVLLGLLGVGVYFWYIWSSNLPYIGVLKDYRPPVVTRVYSADGEVIGRFWEEKRVLVDLDVCPDHLIEAFVAAEDARFFEHEGVDVKSIVRAMIRNFTAGRIEQGGSTITQQVTKSLLLKNPERTYRRKVREATLSLQVERVFTKHEILYLYLNQIYLGQGAYGVQAAADTYFGKTVEDLTLAESALLAGLPQAPARYSPVRHFDRAKARQRYVLERMVEERFITREAFEEALAEELDIREREDNTFQKAPYFTEYVRRDVLERYGREMLYRGGLEIHTTVDLKLQAFAKEALLRGLGELDKREGYRGPLRRIAGAEADRFLEEQAGRFAEAPPKAGDTLEGLVLEVGDRGGAVAVGLGHEKALLPLSHMAWARKPNPRAAHYAAELKKRSTALRPGDVILVRLLAEDPPEGYSWVAALEQTPEAQAAILAMDPATGAVLAMVGGKDFNESQYNRATQAKRQPGSAFKPIVYAAALDKGMTPADILMDSPIIAGGGEAGSVWKPKNYKDTFYGPTLMRTALAQSRNVITVKLLRRIGVPYTIDYARKLGIESDLAPDLSLALGSSGVSLLEMTRAYAVFANEGKAAPPVFVTRIVDRDGRVLEENRAEAEQVISRETAYVMTDLMKAVVEEGTGTRVKALQRPAAGKTGTTNDLRDAWFLGFTPDLVTGVWVGYDDQRSMARNETGSRAASPVWLYFMQAALEGEPVRDFEVPEGIVFARIDAKTGLLPGPSSGRTVLQTFVEGTEPKEVSPEPAAARQGHFSEFDLGFEGN
ncbi:penicillin-binding protein 1A [Desulfatiglans anilini]|uniref:penicillin-binding protein 1A n=1 Tax=Desulfatiglans anilini TaxID=90728 RepID=UPI0003FB625E|nr:PBP1A family penicillin-binding protein [Desulfatiglans anilini]